MPYRLIHDYGLIGDMNSAAFVSRDGSIDWACFPRFDSPSVFAAILDERKGDRFAITPVGESTSEQRYRPETTVSETTFTTATGRVTIVDFMPTPSIHRQEAPHEIIRIVRGIQGTVRLRATFEPRLDYARANTVLSITDGVINAIAGDTCVWLVSDLTFAFEPADDGGQCAVAEFDVSAGESNELVAVYGTAPHQTLDELRTQEKLARSDAVRAAIVAEIDYGGRWRDEVIRSVLTLHLLTYDPSGAIVAAPTSSLPEFIGGSRNWDYRYSWIREAAWTVGILYRLGDAHEGEEYIEWLVSQCWLGLEGMQVLYGISDDSDLAEHELRHLSGYENSGPLRIGNGAAYHRQLDVLGEMILSLATYHKHHGPLSDDGFSEGEGAFFILSFWLVGALLAIDQRPETEGLFDQLIAKANHLGLFAEMWDPAGGRALGNFPQAFSHIGFLHTARNLDSVLNNLQEAPADLLG